MNKTKRQTATIYRNQSGAAVRRMIGYLKSNGYKYHAQPFKVLQAEFERLTGLKKPDNLMFRDWLTYLYNTVSPFLPPAEPGKRRFKSKDRPTKKEKKRSRKREYNEYLRSPEWQAFREKAFQHYGRQCSACRSEKKLQVHHKTYKNIFKEELEDVAILCEPCHEKEHGRKFKYGKK